MQKLSFTTSEKSQGQWVATTDDFDGLQLLHQQQRNMKWGLQQKVEK
jgi:hypothetical protein